MEELYVLRHLTLTYRVPSHHPSVGRPEVTVYSISTSLISEPLLFDLIPFQLCDLTFRLAQNIIPCDK